MKLQTTKIFEKTVERSRGQRIVINQGGTRSSKTFSIIQLLIILAGQSKLLISVVSETIPHLKRGALRDFFNIMGDDFNVNKFNKSELIYTFTNGSQIEFFSADKSDKLKGAGRDILFLNEADRIAYDSYLQLAARTTGKIFIDFNPVQRFWAHDLGIEIIKSNYKDNSFLKKEQVQFIESQKGNENWWRVYGLGEIGIIENIVFRDWKLTEKLPEPYKWRIYGLDFGFTNDPTAMLELRMSGGELWVREHLYEYGKTNQDLIKLIQQKGITEKIICDSAEPKSIEELRRGGLSVEGAEKTKIIYGIQLLNSYKLNITKDSVNLQNELKNYMYRKKDGKTINEPVDAYNHLIDALRYAVIYKLGKKGSKLLFVGT